MYNYWHVAGIALQPHLDVCVIQILYGLRKWEALNTQACTSDEKQEFRALKVPQQAKSKKLSAYTPTRTLKRPI